MTAWESPGFQNPPHTSETIICWPGGPLVRFWGLGRPAEAYKLSAQENLDLNDPPVHLQNYSSLGGPLAQETQENHLKLPQAQAKIT